MKKNLISFLLTLFLCAISSNNLFAQFTISGEIRPRAEFRNGYKKLTDTDNNFAAFISQRSRLALFYKNEKITTKLSLQDIRVWGDEKINTDIAGTALYEAWAELPVCDNLFIKLGKQELAYDNERFLSAGSWPQVGLTHNAVVFKYKSREVAAHLGGGFNQTSENILGTDYSLYPGNYKSLTYLWLSDKFSDKFKVSALAIADGFQKAETTNTIYLRGTYGFNAEYATDNEYGIALRCFYQSGKLATGQEVSAYYGKADVNYFATPDLNLIVGIEYISGNDATDQRNKVSNVFCTLYGASHKYNGNMDYFTNMTDDTKGAGLVNPYLSLNYKLSNKSSMVADFHYFRLQNNYIVASKTIDKGLGQEIDLSFSHTFSKEVSLLAGVSALQGTESLSYLKGGNYHKIATWAFAMLTVKPTFFESGGK